MTYWCWLPLCPWSWGWFPFPVRLQCELRFREVEWGSSWCVGRVRRANLWAAVSCSAGLCCTTGAWKFEKLSENLRNSRQMWATFENLSKIRVKLFRKCASHSNYPSYKLNGQIVNYFSRTNTNSRERTMCNLTTCHWYYLGPIKIMKARQGP